MKHRRLYKKKIKIGDTSFNIINIVLFLLFSFACIYPFYYIIINSITDNRIVIAGGVRLFPKGVHFQNYIRVFSLNGIGRATMISIARTVLATVAMLISSTVLGYAMTRPEYWHRKFWYRYMVITMYFSAGIIPVFMNIRRLGLYDNFWVYVIPAFVAPYNMILVKTYIESIPASLEEAAIMDGGGYVARITRIIIPLCKPIIATIVVFTAVGQWNSYMDTRLYMLGSENQTLQSMLYMYLNQSNMLAQLVKEGKTEAEAELSALQYAANPQSVRFAMTVITLVPVLLVYPFAQRYFTKGIMIGAVKG